MLFFPPWGKIIFLIDICLQRNKKKPDRRDVKRRGRWENLCVNFTNICSRERDEKLILSHIIWRTANGFSEQRTDFGEFQHTFRLILSDIRLVKLTANFSHNAVCRRLFSWQTKFGEIDFISAIFYVQLFQTKFFCAAFSNKVFLCSFCVLTLYVCNIFSNGNW